MTDPLVAVLRKPTIELSIKYRLPVAYPFREDPEAGGFLSYGTNQQEQYHRAASIADKILKGARPADLPIEQPTKFELIINTRAAKALGLTVPPALLLRADRVIQ